MSPHLSYVPMLDDDGTEHRGSFRCECPRTRSHKAENWKALLAEQREALAARDS